MWFRARNVGGKVGRKSRIHTLRSESLETRCVLAASMTGSAGFNLESQIDASGVFALNQGVGTDRFFSVVDEIPSATLTGAQAPTQPLRFTALTLDAQGMQAELAKAPLEGTSAAAHPLILNVPAPNQTFSRFAIVESPVMESGLYESFPGIRTYVGQGIDDPTATLRADFTALGFHAQVLTPHGAWYVDPYWHMDQSAYISYFKADLASGLSPASLTEDLEIDAVEEGSSTWTGGGPEAIVSRRDVRTAVTTTTSYNGFFGNNVTNVLSGVTTAINRITGVYEVDVAVRLLLVNDTTRLFSGLSGVGTDNPNGTISGTNVSALSSNNQSFTDTRIGNANYDMGHVFGRTEGNGGISGGGIGIVGRTGLKAQAATSVTPVNGDLYYIDYVAHEMGHQFGGRHNFNNCSGSLGDSASFSNEPASGSTIMGYAGICSVNVQSNSTAAFNYINLNQINTYLAGGLPVGMPAPVVTTNNTPTIDALSNYQIPDQTPFRLTATGSDPDGDVVTYTWEQANTGNVNPNPATDPGSGPIIRSRPGVTSGIRTIPPMANVLAGNTQPTGEVLPSTTRVLNFRVTARDNRAGGGGVTQATMQINSTNSGTGFRVTAPDTAVSWAGGSFQTVTWNVSGSNAAPINTTDVRILLSTDGGTNFSTVLSASTANDGSEVVQMPFGVGTSTARVMIEALGNIYFDVSNVNFTITNVTDTTAPTALGSAANVATAGGTSHLVDVVYSDNVAILASSLGSNDIVVMAPDSSVIPVTWLSQSSNSNITPINGQYGFTPPGGAWDAADNGLYTIMAVAGGVTDTALNPLAAGSIGTFTVAISNLAGDFNGDGELDCADVNALSAAVATASTDLQYDLTGDGFVTTADLDKWITDLKQTLPGDANLDFFVDGSDFNIWNANKFSTNTDWCAGNFNGDVGVDASDFNIWNAFKFQAARPGVPLTPAKSSVATLFDDRQDARLPERRIAPTIWSNDQRQAIELPAVRTRLSAGRTVATRLHDSVFANWR